MTATLAICLFSRFQPVVTSSSSFLDHPYLPSPLSFLILTWEEKSREEQGADFREVRISVGLFFRFELILKEKKEEKRTSFRHFQQILSAFQLPSGLTSPLPDKNEVMELDLRFCRSIKLFL
ncbi:Hypothetical protein NTJ_00325 [Nesidiocoris tenuis]|uniref:Uncharacterized protein n=1 Tax=Nesidiocoris tenuis TaxID=355587 RepID=A0ABN7A5V5_9HEMI|nr:Hypothetical protein NTJ_00325 [Nesidiocoris tenuis]